MLQMAKKGRKPKHNVERFPGGQIKSDPRILGPAEFARMRDLVGKAGLHPVWVCELWRRAHQGMISNEQRVAGDMFLRLRDEHRKVCLGSPREHPKAQSLEGSRGRAPDVDLDQLDDELRRQELHYIDTVQKRWDRACAVLADLGLPVWRATAELVLDNEVQWIGAFQLAKKGLQGLAKHFGLVK